MVLKDILAYRIVELLYYKCDAISDIFCTLTSNTISEKKLIILKTTILSNSVRCSSTKCLFSVKTFLFAFLNILCVD